MAILSLKEQMKIAIKILKAGGVVVFPTETVYGLAADAMNPKAVRRIFTIKKRDLKKSLPLIAADLKMVEKYVVLSPIIKKLVEKNWPGPLTVVAPARPVGARHGAPQRGAPQRDIAIRVSAHPIARELSKRLGRPIVSTSANLSGQPVCYSVRAVRNQLVGMRHGASQPDAPQPDGYLDVGRLPRRKPSKIIMEKGGEIIVLRP